MNFLCKYKLILMIVLIGLPDFLFSADVDVTHLPITKFSYPGRKITIKAVLKPVDTSVTSATLMYKSAGEYNYTKFVVMKTNIISTNYICTITNSDDTLNDIEYRLKITFTNLGLTVTKFVPSGTDYYMDINPTEVGRINTDTGGSVILPDDDPTDLKYTGLKVPPDALYTFEFFGIDTFVYSSILNEIIKNNQIVKDNNYLNNNTVPFALYYFYKKNGIRKENYAFRKKVNIKLRYFDEDNNGKIDDTGVSENNIGLFFYDGLKWRYLNSTIDIDNNTVSFNSYSLSWYGLFKIDKQASNISTELIDYVSRPSFSPLRGEIVEFGIKLNIAEYMIKIFDHKGRVVRELRSNTWDGKNENGKYVESGVYVYQVIARSKVKSGMICIVK